MSMEFFAWPHMEKFFGSDADKYRYMHALESFSFIPYGTMVDHFQHIVYKHPDMSPAERDRVWLELEASYRPHISMDGMPYLDRGTRWQYQMHIYESPFYYIDYCLAQTAAFRFLLASREDYGDAFRRYIAFSRQGGEKVWTDLLDEAGFPTPFKPGALGPFAADIENLLREIRV
jgi:oligoendopeptidase F